ncbi:ABC-three component system middle component 2 [Streptomyces sp. NPDC002814]
MMTPLNSPIEVGMRILSLLNEFSPRALGISHLTYFDYCMLHSADFGGPESLHPKLPVGPGEFGIKRKLIEGGLQLMLRAGLIEVRAADTGIIYGATESASGFIEVLDSDYLDQLQQRASWVAREMAFMDDQQLAEAMKEVYVRWAEGIDPNAVSAATEEYTDE